jgi:hypothetical protein
MTIRIGAYAVSALFSAVLSAQNITNGGSSPAGIITPNDPIRTNELQNRILLDRIRQQDREVKARVELEKLQFEAKFRALVSAANNFIRQYNEGNGSVWPQREAEELGRAMGKVQDTFSKHRRPGKDVNHQDAGSKSGGCATIVAESNGRPD